MSGPYDSTSISGYNSSPPSDDGSQVASNHVEWQKHLDKIGGPLKTAIEAINSELVTTFNTIYGQTQVEADNLVTPANPHFFPGDSRRYGVASDGSTDDAGALQDWLDGSAGDVVARLYPGTGNTRCSATLNIPSNTVIELMPGSVLEATTDDAPLLKGLGVTDVTIRGPGEILGVQGTTDWPSPSTNGEGLVYFVNNGATNCERIRIEGVHINRTWTPISCIEVQGLWVENNICHNYMRYGVLASKSSDFHINNNNIYDSNVTSGNAYGVMATGDEDGGATQERNEICFNTIREIQAWDGIMTHDCSRLNIIGNTIDDVRIGIDIGHVATTNIVDDVVISDNNITLTTVDAWSGSGAIHGGILCIGQDASNRIQRLTITGNIVENFNSMTGSPTMSGDGAAITVEHCDNWTITGNAVSNVGTALTVPGIYLIGTLNSGTVTGNSLQGTMASGAIRLAGVTADVLAITGNSVKQATASDNAVLITGSTVTNASILGNPTNSTAPFSYSTSTIGFDSASPAFLWTATLTGCTTSPTANIDSSVSGDVVTLEIPAITGTSNTTAATLTGMPTELRPAATQTVVGITTDNGTTAFGKITISTGGVMTLHVAQSATFTASGTKGVAACTVSYRLT